MSLWDRRSHFRINET